VNISFFKWYGRRSMDLGLAVDDAHPPLTVVAVTGDIDVATAPSLRALLVDLIADGKINLLVDLTAVGFLDSTALGVLVSTVKRVRAGGGDLALVCTSPHIIKVLEITGLTTVFAVHGALEAAFSN
jgi:anti-sigma B factor antagonist